MRPMRIGNAGTGASAAMRESKIERAIREHLAAQPDEAFSTDDSCAVCYPDAARIKRKLPCYARSTR
jgi:hypothetical protein